MIIKHARWTTMLSKQGVGPIVAKEEDLLHLPVLYIYYMYTANSDIHRHRVDRKMST
jgi:hypothetical protein